MKVIGIIKWPISTTKCGNGRKTLWEQREGMLNIFWEMRNKDDVQKRVITKSEFLAENEASSGICLQENLGYC